MPDALAISATVAIALAAALLLARPFSRVGFTATDVGIVASAPLVASFDLGLFQLGASSIAVNGAGFLVPLALSLKVLVVRRAPLLITLAAVAVVSVVAYLASYAVPGQGVLLRYQAPALAACGVALVLARARFDLAGPVAFVAGAMGVVVGADILRVPELAAYGPSRIIVGGAGVLDGIFLVGVLAAVLVFVAQGAWIAAEWAVRRTTKAPAPG